VSSFIRLAQWIPAFAGMTGAEEGVLLQITVTHRLLFCAPGFRDRLRLFRRTSGSLALAREISEEENA
jgi:hypothetical protein